MSLLSLTRAIHPESFRKDAVLLSMLPYGIADYDTISLLFVHPSDRSRLVRSLEKQGLLVRRSTKVTTSHRGKGKGKTVHRRYQQGYLVLTYEGIRYLVEYYSPFIGWLPCFDERCSGAVPCRGSMTNRQLQLMLSRQSASLFFSLAGCETYYERMLTAPVEGRRDVPAIMQTLAPIASCITVEASADYTPNVFARWMRWKETIEEVVYAWDWCIDHYPEAVAELDRPCPMRFYAADELRELYRLRRKTPVTDHSMTNHNHIGVLVGQTEHGPSVKVVYMACRNGMNWNLALTKRNARLLHRQIHEVCAGRDATGSAALPSLLLVHNAKEFRLSVTDEKAMCQSRKIRLGQGAASLSLVPMDGDGMALVSKLCCEISYESQLGRKLTAQKLTQPSPPGSAFPYVYQGLPCTTCFSLDVARIYQCMDREHRAGEGSTAVVCWEWQRTFLRTVLPGAKVAGIRERRRG